MIEPAYTYRFDLALFDALYCPTCKLRLNRVQLVDIFVQGFACKNKHRFYITLQEPNCTESAKCSKIRGPYYKNFNSLELGKKWLMEFEYRSKLNNQLATIVRRIYEISMMGLRVPYDASTQQDKVFHYCLLCKEPLKLFSQSDAWVEGLKCPNNHEYFSRNGLTFSFHNKSIIFHDEMSDKTLTSLINLWLAGGKELATQLHDQVKLILEDYLKGKK